MLTQMCGYHDGDKKAIQCFFFIQQKCLSSLFYKLRGFIDKERSVVAAISLQPKLDDDAPMTAKTKTELLRH